jgi:hypothetical protein
MKNPNRKKLDAPELVAFSLLALITVVAFVCYAIEPYIGLPTETDLPVAEVTQRATALELKAPLAQIVEPSEESTAPETELTTEAATEPETEPVQEPETTEPAIPELDPWEVELIARTIWGEADGVKSKAEQAAVAWCILNRVDAWGQSIEYVVTKPYQFLGYRPTGNCPERHYELARDVLTRWYAEKAGETNVGRTLPPDYLYFIGDLKAHNWFSIVWQSGVYWDWSLPSPYDT